jgi:hypothetical protein|tara:strand:+ start:1183 stop:1362 length:180 start_codon:yes stop_codon:yes gene_type:complete
MKYKFNTREELVEMFNSISTPHSHSIQLYGNYAEIKWDGQAPEDWSKYKEKKSKNNGKS